jgi:uncharacterized protein (UPF0303 family)
MTAPLTLEQLVEQDRAIDFDRFGHTEAWQVGRWIAETAIERDLRIAAMIWLGEQLVFATARPGTSADLDQWMRRKAALVRRYDVNSWLTTHRIRGWGLTEPVVNIGLDPAAFTLSGGGFPIRVHGSTVGVAVVSGISDETDHAIVAEALGVAAGLQAH